jgi:hypothetical protein
MNPGIGWICNCRASRIWRLGLSSLEALLGSDLRIRVRRTMWGSTTGAVWIPAPGGGAWSGDLFACVGMGKEQRFRPWPAGPNTEA